MQRQETSHIERFRVLVSLSSSCQVLADDYFSWCIGVRYEIEARRSLAK